MRDEPGVDVTERRGVGGSGAGSATVGGGVEDDHLAAAVGASVRGWIQESAADRDPPTLIVALSGGLDSCVLLHALRFGAHEAPVMAAHFDHRMRPGSREDASWVRGLCRAWDMPLEVGVRREVGAASADHEISEAEARRLRYDFLHGVRRRHAPSLLLTAHHADDQAETVLFRILRGTGIDGLSGIPAARPPGIVRPLLPFWRKELEAYARRHGLGWRDDPTNRDVGHARNLVRHRILPLGEEAMPGARRALVRLADVAGEEGAAWSEALERLEASLDVRTAGHPPAEPELPVASTTRSEGGEQASIVSLDRDGLASLGPELRARFVRHLVRRHLGSTVPDRKATGRAVAFAAEGGSGRRIELGGGVEMARELDRIELRRTSSDPGPRQEADRELVIEGVPQEEKGAHLAGCGVARLTGCAYRVGWEACSAEGAHRGDDPSTVLLSLDHLVFPLRVRSRRPGDRMSTPAGTRKLKKIFLEARVPARRRDGLPVLVDAAGEVLWVPGVARAEHLAPAGSHPVPGASRPAPDATSGAGPRAGATPGAALRITIEPDHIDG